MIFFHLHEVLDGSLLDTPKHKRLLRVRKEPRTALTTGTTRGRSYDVGRTRGASEDASDGARAAKRYRIARCHARGATGPLRPAGAERDGGVRPVSGGFLG